MTQQTTKFRCNSFGLEVNPKSNFGFPIAKGGCESSRRMYFSEDVMLLPVRSTSSLTDNESSRLRFRPAVLSQSVRGIPAVLATVGLFAACSVGLAQTQAAPSDYPPVVHLTSERTISAPWTCWG